MTWEPCELQGWTLAGYGVDKVDHWAYGIDYFMAMNDQTLGRLKRADVDCTDEDWTQLLSGVEAIEAKGLALDNWSWCIHQLLSHFPDTTSTCDTIVGAGPGLSWSGIAVYARKGTEERFLELLEQLSLRFRGWADDVLADGRARQEERVRQFLARKHGVDPNMFKFWPDQLPEYDGASSLDVFALGLDEEAGDEEEGCDESEANASC